VCVLYFLIFVQIRSWIGQTRLLKIIDDGAAFRIIGRIGCNALSFGGDTPEGQNSPTAETFCYKN